VAEDHEQRRAQMDARVLKRPEDFRRDDVAGNAHDEQLAEAGVEHQFGGTRESLQPRIVA
jgi:hypothetical protein